MESLKFIFWNAGQSRIRTGFRVAVLLALVIALGEGVGAVIKSIDPAAKLNSDAPYWFFIVFAGSNLATALISVWLTGRFVDRRAFVDFGFSFDREWWLDFSFGLFLGMFLISGIFAIENLLGWVTITEVYFVREPSQLFLLPLTIFIALFVCVGISEELISRGYLLVNISEGLNLKRIGPEHAILIAWILSSVVFGLFHIDNPNATVISTLNIMLGGVLLGLAYVLTGALAIPIGLHITWNFFQGNVFGFPVSGITLPAKVVTIIKSEQAGPELWTGGTFGPEAGLLGLAAMLAGFILILAWVRYRKGAIGLQKSLANAPTTSNALDSA